LKSGAKSLASQVRGTLTLKSVVSLTISY